MNEDEIKLNSFIHKYFVDSKKKSISEDLTYKNISKIVSERYIGNSTLNIKIFFYSEGSEGNNKPYTFRERSLKEFAMFNELLEKTRMNQSNVFDVIKTDLELTLENQSQDTVPLLVVERSDTNTIKGESTSDEPSCFMS